MMPRGVPKGTMPPCSDRGRERYAKRRTWKSQPPLRSRKICSERSNAIPNDSLLPGARHPWPLLWTERKPAFPLGMKCFLDHAPPGPDVTGHFGIARGGFLMLHLWVLTSSTCRRCIPSAMPFEKEKTTRLWPSRVMWVVHGRSDRRRVATHQFIQSWGPLKIFGILYLRLQSMASKLRWISRFNALRTTLT